MSSERERRNKGRNYGVRDCREKKEKSRIRNEKCELFHRFGTVNYLIFQK